MEGCCEGMRMGKKKEKRKKNPHFLMQQDKNKNDVNSAKEYGIEEVGGFKFILDGEVVGESGEWKTCGISWSYESKGGDGMIDE